MDNISRIAASYRLFDKLKCCSRDLNADDIKSGRALAFLDEEKMQCHIINCLMAFRIVQRQRRKQKRAAENEETDLVKKKVFAATLSMIIDVNFDSKEVVVNSIFSAFPDEDKIFDERLWLPMHWAIGLFNRNKISEDDISELYSSAPLAMHRFSENDDSSVLGCGCTPAHLLCMQKEPNMSLVRYFCLRDPKAFLMCDKRGRCALYLVAKYSQSLELLQSILQIDHKMTNIDFVNHKCEESISPLGTLCRRLEFPSFHNMISSLIAVDSTVEVIFDGVIGCLQSFGDSIHDDLSPGSRGERALTLLEKLLNANPNVTIYTNSKVTTYKDSNILHEACTCRRGKFGIAVIKTFLNKFKNGIKNFDDEGFLPIHIAARFSSLDVVKFLYEVYPESLSMVTNDDNNLLHLAFYDTDSGRSRSFAHVEAKVEYLCDLCPIFMHMTDSDGKTPLHCAFTHDNVIDVESIKIICNADETVVRDKCTITSDNDDNGEFFGMLPLHLLIHKNTPISEVSREGDCFRLFLRLYPASAGIKDSHSKSPYDLAISKNLSVYFIRLLLAAEPTIDPNKRHNLNFAARREGMFLAFRALSTNRKSTIWARIRYEDRDLLAHIVSYL